MRKLGRAALAAGCGGALAAALALGAHAEPAPVATPATATLGDAIALAYQTNPTLQSERAQLRATDEGYVQAEAGLRPTLGVTGSYTYQEGQITEPGAPSFGLSGGAGSAGVNASQPLYTGGRVSSRIDAAKADILAERENLRRIEIGVLQNVIGAYLDVRRDTDALAIANDNVKVLQRELDETSARFDAGQLTRTDVAQSQARLALAKSQASTALATLAQSRAAYRAVVGQEPGELAPQPPIDQLLPPDVDAAFDAAERDNPQVRQAAFVEAGSAARLAEAKAATRPTLTLNGTYGYQGSLTGVFTGSGIASGLEQERGGSVSVQASAPVFTGGLTLSQIRQAAAQDDANQIAVEGARRQARHATAQAWNQLLGAKASLVSDEETVRSDQVAFEGVTEEQKVGLRTVLDVLNAQQELESAQLTLVGARHDAYIAAAAVLAATGALTPRDFAPDQRLYDPKANFERIRHAWGWVPWEPAVGVLDRLGAPQPAPQTPPPDDEPTAKSR